MPTTMTLLPRTTSTTLLPATEEGMDIAAEATIPEHEILLTSQTGAISVLSPLSESQYRKLSTLANHLSNTVYHACGLNPRAYRVGSGKETQDGMVGGRTVVDGGLLLRWNELGSQRRAEVASRVGVSVEEEREDVVALVGGLGYL
jgi:cleavage and polyadenylation specificity factor subunit 1